VPSETRVTNPRDLKTVTRRIHDHWFDVADVSNDSARRVLRVKFRRPSETGERTIRRVLFFRRVRVPVTEWWLEIRKVESHTIRETERIGRYDFNELQFSEPDRILSVKTGVPLVFQVVVSELDIAVGDTGKVVEEKVYTTV